MKRSIIILFGCIFGAVMPANAQNTAIKDSLFSNQKDTLERPVLRSTASSGGLGVKIPQVIPPSPNAASLAMYADYPVSHYTGVPNIDIPLYEIQVDGFKLPISLSYHASGIKVGQEASWVGLGWALNAGGCISRTIKCADDLVGEQVPPVDGYIDSPEIIHGNWNDFLNTHIMFQSLGGGLTLYPRLKKDSEPDIFYCNLPGYSSKFFIDKNKKAVFFDQSQKVIMKYNHSEEIVMYTGDGIEYFFNKTERTEGYTSPESMNGIDDGYVIPETSSIILSASGDWTTGGSFSDYISSWYLGKIVLPDKEQITFEYEKDEYLSPTQENITDYSAFNRVSCYVNRSKSKSKSENLRLSKITWKGGYVTFTASAREDMKALYGQSPKKLDKITIFSNTGNIKSFKFDYEYFNNRNWGNYNYLHKRLKLTNLRESDNAGYENSKPYSFEYHEGSMPRKNSNNADAWGYCNGKEYGDFPIREAYISGVYLEGVDKSNSLPHLKIGTLNRINYPFGGYADFEYEENAFQTGNNDDWTEFGMIESIPENYHIHVSNEVTTDECQYAKTGSVSFHADGTVPVKIRYHAEDRQTNCVKKNGALLGKLIRKDNGAVILRINYPECQYISENDYYSGDYVQNLAEGEYVFEALEVPEDMCVNWTIEGRKLAERHVSGLKGGGLRIAKIKTNATERFFEYDEGTLLTIPLDFYIDSNSSFAGCGNQNSYIVRQSNSMKPLGGFKSGSPVGYGKVKEYQRSGSEISSTEYRFHNTFEESQGIDYSLFAFMPNIPVYSNGLPYLIKYEDKNGSVKEVEYEYENTVTDVINARYCPNWKTHIRTTASYQYSVEWWKNTKKTETIDGIATTEEYTYNTDNYRQNQIVTYDSRGINTKQIIKYPTDFTDAVSLGMKNKYMIGLPIEKIFFNNFKVVAAQKTTYKDTLNTYLPKTISALNTVSPLTLTNYEQYYRPEVNFVKYNSKGKYLDLSDRSGNSIVYVWGYNNQYPIAEITGSSYSEVLSKISGGQATLDALAAKNAPSAADLQTINNLRTSLPDASVTTYTYKPLVGILTSIDPHNQRTTYIYDTFNRLQCVKDHNGKVIGGYEYHFQNQ